ncbi:type I toxin-antitoxin system toxin Ldr family protein [Escherichia coli]|nr:type I toxin-antitoxin system toxin Ldr family protein [Escherichia coli]
MTLAQIAMTYRHDLAAPIQAGIINSEILSWWRNRK